MSRGKPRYLPGGHGRELVEQRNHVRDMLQHAQRIAVLCTVTRGERRYYRVIVTNKHGEFYSPTGAIAAALGFRVVDGEAGHIEIVLNGGNFDGHHEIASELGKLLGRELAFDRL